MSISAGHPGGLVHTPASHWQLRRTRAAFSARLPEPEQAAAPFCPRSSHLQSLLPRAFEHYTSLPSRAAMLALALALPAACSRRPREERLLGLHPSAWTPGPLPLPQCSDISKQADISSHESGRGRSICNSSTMTHSKAVLEITRLDTKKLARSPRTGNILLRDCSAMMRLVMRGPVGTGGPNSEVPCYITRIKNMLYNKD